VYCRLIGDNGICTKDPFFFILHSDFLLSRRREQRDAYSITEPREIAISCENGVTSIHRGGADQKIRVRTVNPALAATIEKFSRHFVVFSSKYFVSKRSKPIPQNLKLLL
jgi:hypothetical protein